MKLAKEDHNEDAAFSKALHGHSVNESGIAAMRNKSPTAYQAVVDGYLGCYAGDSGIDGSEQARQARKNSYATVGKRYYDLMTDHFEYAFGKSLHFCQIFPGEPLSVGTVKHEHYLAGRLGLQTGNKVLDVGCGVGGPAREISKFADVSVTGLNNNDYQLQRGIRYTEAEGLSDRVMLIKGDFMQIHLDPQSFDAAYAIEATCYAPSLEAVYSEVFKTLKSGGTFAVYELILTDVYNNEDPEHRKIRDGLERALGMTNIATTSQAIEAMQSAGFEIQEAEDLACRPDTIPWHYQISGSLASINSIWDVGKILKWGFLRSRIAAPLVGALEALHVVPPGSRALIVSTKEGIDWVVLAARKKLFTPIFFMVGRKRVDNLA